MEITMIQFVTRKLWELAQFQDGEATVPAYLLEQLAIAADVVAIEDAQFNERAS